MISVERNGKEERKQKAGKTRSIIADAVYFLLKKSINQIKMINFVWNSETIQRIRQMDSNSKQFIDYPVKEKKVTFQVHATKKFFLIFSHRKHCSCTSKLISISQERANYWSMMKIFQVKQVAVLLFLHVDSNFLVNEKEKVLEWNTNFSIMFLCAIIFS